MKKYLITLFALMAFFGAKAQNGEIIYTDFEPDLTLVEGINSHDSIMLDIDYDGVYDLKFFLVFYHFTVPVYEALNGWSLCAASDSTILDSENLIWRPDYYLQPYTTYIGLKKVVGEDCYYGWLYTYDGQTKNDKGTKAGTLFIDRVAYCTIPNYPLRAGQTSLTVGVNEHPTEQTFATIYPNPSTGLITITGTDLKQAEVLNALGQRVATAEGKGETLQIHIANLPAGVYFVSITDEEGHKCVRKVVKE